jgi:hypothetical protein
MCARTAPVPSCLPRAEPTWVEIPVRDMGHSSAANHRGISCVQGQGLPAKMIASSSLE